MLRIARGGATGFVTVLTLAICMLSLAGPLGMPSLTPLSMVPFSLSLALLFFFRDPERQAAQGVVSPADGVIRLVDDVDDADLGRCHRLSIFMSPLDVHVNRMPVAGSIKRVQHTPGGHIPAFKKDSERNERVETWIKSDDGPEVKVIQIAGTVARRVVPYLEAGKHYEKGERLGLIRFSSRCDLLIPVGTARWTVGEQVRVQASRSQVGRLT